MAMLSSFILPLLAIALLIPFSVADKQNQSFLHCISSNLHHSNISSLHFVFPRNSSIYTSVFTSSIRNKRFFRIPDNEKPEFIITPFNESHIQATIVCAKANNLQIRARSAGHDYEGLSYISDEKFVLVDLASMRSINIDTENGVAWVQSGATLGEFYYNIAKKTNVYGFPAGSCPTVGVGGHFSGGGFGTIFRKYGLAVDTVIDAKLVDATGRILDRNSMGEDFFWAIRGGGGASFCVIFSWKVRLVSVPSTVTVFRVSRTLEQNGSQLLQKWQTIGPKLDKELFLHVVTGVERLNTTKSTVRITFDALYLGEAEKVVSLLQNKFPELGLTRKICTEMNWIQSVLYFAGFSTSESIDVLTNRTTQSNSFFKAKSDYVTEPINQTGLEGLYERLIETDTSILIFTPYGGIMSEISESEIPFPHRNGNLYGIQYIVSWDKEEQTNKTLKWLRDLYSYMKPYVSKSPRAAYFNYRDLDIGRNYNKANTSFAQASVWGLKYFKNNFKRLVQVKTAVDPSNFFWNEQSIPVFKIKY